ncbi:MAG TPA: glycogen debranching enzyme N-terminal domain-containing protein, partial [Thermoanaerobaculia bacterium]|nr:glycogen debranching enzyme N-terminal domain-containing protein [Thermoanaerobaculia bacterium]
MDRAALEWRGEDLSSTGQRTSLEWIETDGLGGFACGCAGGSTRPYHGWYAPPSAERPVPVRRPPLVAGCEEYVWCAGETVALREVAAEAGDAARPLARFALDPFPTWRYETGNFSLERSLCLVRGRPIAIARYANLGSRSVGLRARPLIRAEEKPSGGGASAGAGRFAARVSGEASWLSDLPGRERLFLRGSGAKASNAARGDAAAF